jgi:hypothetical protein
MFQIAQRFCLVPDVSGCCTQALPGAAVACAVAGITGCLIQLALSGGCEHGASMRPVPALPDTISAADCSPAVAVRQGILGYGCDLVLAWVPG